MVMGLGFFTAAGVAAVVYSLVHHIIVKTALFLIGGVIDHTSGTSRLSEIGDLVRSAPRLAVMFLVAALGLAGIPPLSGFISKYALVEAGVSAHHLPIVAVSLVVSLLTLFSMIRIWSAVFWSPAEEPVEIRPDRRPPAGRAPLAMMLPTVGLVACSLAVAAAAGPIYAFSQRTAGELLDPGSYITAVSRP
jgi:multicomponent Na+:H+ antiporter subunit D